ncbi:MAG: peptidoglycan recognition family protein [Planctomycetota bacterium]
MSETTPHPESADRRDALRRIGTAAVALAGVSFLAACSTGRKGQVGKPIPQNPGFTPLGREAPRIARRTFDPATGSVARAEWARFGPNESLADRMVSPAYITVHHDGMSRFDDRGSRAAAERLETIRRSHVGRGWADIGYHYAIDPAGRIWQARPLALQGAHVRANNEANIGIVVLGNYELQRPSSASIASLAALVDAEMNRFSVPVSSVMTHREWAPTACPGRSLQAEVDRLRARGGRELARIADRFVHRFADRRPSGLQSA